MLGAENNEDKTPCCLLSDGGLVQNLSRRYRHVPQIIHTAVLYGVVHIGRWKGVGFIYSGQDNI